MYNLKKLTGNKKGFTIVELIISMTVLAIIIVPIMSSFASIAAINVKTKQQHEVDAVMRTIEQNIIDDGRTMTVPSTNNTIVTHSPDANYSNFRFDILEKNQVNSGHTYINNLFEYKVVIKKMKGAAFINVQSFNVLVHEG